MIFGVTPGDRPIASVSELLERRSEAPSSS